MTAELDGWGDQTVGDSDGSVHQPRWSEGDDVVIRSAVQLIDGARGWILAVGLPGPSPVKVQTTNRRGISAVHVREDELRPATLPDPGGRVACVVTECKETAEYLTDRCRLHPVGAELRP